METDCLDCINDAPGQFWDIMPTLQLHSGSSRYRRYFNRFPTILVGCLAVTISLGGIELKTCCLDNTEAFEIPNFLNSKFRDLGEVLLCKT
jgi:hypothetical protein